MWSVILSSDTFARHLIVLRVSFSTKGLKGDHLPKVVKDISNYEVQLFKRGEVMIGLKEIEFLKLLVSV